MKTIFLIDGNSLLYRAYFSTGPLTNNEGFPTNALYGLANMLLRIMAKNPDYAVAAFDTKEPTFRHKMFSEYKAQRKPPEDSLVLQMQPARDLVRAFGIRVIEMPGYEADDIIGTIAKRAEKKDTESCIWTGDLDSLQLIDDKISVYHTVKGVSDVKIYDRSAVKERYDVTVDQFVDFKSLKGDASDNIPGVPGIGDKTAAKLLNEYGSLTGIYDNIESMKEGKTKRSLTEFREQAFLSEKLARIDTNIPLAEDFDLWQYIGFNHKELYKLASLYQFRSLYSFIDKSQIGEEEDEKEEIIREIEPTDIENDRDLEKLLEDLKGEKTLSFHFDYVPETKRFVSCSVYSEKLGLFRITMEKEESLLDNIIFDEPFHLEPGDLKLILEDENIEKIVFDSKNLIKIFKNYGIDIKNISFDTYLAGYVKDAGRVSDTQKKLKEDLFRTELDADAYANFLCYKKLKEELTERESLGLLLDVEQPLAYVLADMERTGVEVDREKLKNLSQYLNEELQKTEEKIYYFAGHEFNILSPKQLADVLFEELEIPYPKKSKKYSTGAEILEQLREYPIVNYVLEYRELSKVKSTYADALLKQVSFSDGRIHTTFLQTGTQTGRLSSEKPNIQNIPNREGVGMKVREAFVSAKGHSLISCDYSQIEFRIFAHITGDRALIRAFEEGIDFHTAAAMNIFGAEKEEVTKDMRSVAKTMNFAILYGMGAYTLGRELGKTVREANDFINEYFDRFPEIRKTKERILAEAREKGFVSTINNRRLYISDFSAGNHFARQAAERAAVNMPFQGSAADIMKIAMNNIYDRIKRENKDIKILLQVHDEIVCECPDDIAEESALLIKEEMEKAYKLKVPLVAECKIGKNWADMKTI
ncbi:MAG: DNA polymerase I [Armatimonadetes bacterium]|nr:DNA polymerase I [Candidatus Hippobium faecium]